jgi:GT2 family glycosyltransferase
MARKPLPWPSTRALFTVAAMAMRMAPLASLLRLGELLRGKRVRAWNGLCRLADSHPDSYSYWRAEIAPLRVRNWIGAAQSIDNGSVVRLEDTDAVMLTDLLEQQSRRGLAWLVPVLPGDMLDPSLPQLLASALARHPDAGIIYWDEDVKTSAGPAFPWIKPGWDLLLHLARDCLSGASALHVETALATAARLPSLPVSAAGLAELQLAMLAKGVNVAHLPLVLTQRGRSASVDPEWPARVRQHWPDWRLDARHDGLPFWRVQPPEPAAWPAVSFIIPTRDRVDLLRTCLSSLARLTYPGNVEIIIVDNGSSDLSTLALLEAEQAAGRIKVLRDDGGFNFARLNNRAAAMARGELLCLFNNDVEALDGDFLSAMVRHATRPGVGAVGAQLLYPDGSIQHAGVSIGTGNAAGHTQRGADPASLHHAGWHAVTRQVSVVTAACLLVTRAHYRQVGGLDEAGFAVAFNDVDFCLKLQVEGLANIYCAEARLIHAESRTRPSDNRSDQAARFARELALLQSRWQTELCQDPHHSPLFSRSSETCLLSLA